MRFAKENTFIHFDFERYYQSNLITPYIFPSLLCKFLKAIEALELAVSLHIGPWRQGLSNNYLE